MRTGKIARLPDPIRHQLNCRLRDGHYGADILRWLNALPEVRQIIDHQFAGQPVTKQNLYQWHKGGYHDWFEQQEVWAHTEQLAAHTAAIESTTGHQLPKSLTVMLQARYAVLLNSWDGKTLSNQFERTVRALHTLTLDLDRFHKKDQAAQPEPPGVSKAQYHPVTPPAHAQPNPTQQPHAPSVGRVPTPGIPPSIPSSIRSNAETISVLPRALSKTQYHPVKPQPHSSIGPRGPIGPIAPVRDEFQSILNHCFAELERRDPPAKHMSNFMFTPRHEPARISHAIG